MIALGQSVSHSFGSVQMAALPIQPRVIGEGASFDVIRGKIHLAEQTLDQLANRRVRNDVAHLEWLLS